MHLRRSLPLFLGLLALLLSACGGAAPAPQAQPSEPAPAAATAAPEGEAQRPTPAPEQPAPPAGEQKTLVGAVVSASGDPVAGAQIVVIDASGAERVGAQSDADGQFEISLPLGSYTFEARAEGYTTYREGPVDISMVDLLYYRLEPAGGEPAQPGAQAGGGLEQLQSYRLAYTLSYDGSVGGKPTSGTIDLARAVATGGQRRSESVSWKGTPIGDVDITFALDSYRIDGKSYTITRSDGKEFCQSEVDAAAMLGSFQPDLVALADGDYGAPLGDEEVGGVAATRHRVERSDASGGRYAADLWVAKQGGYIVKSVGSVVYDAPFLRPELSVGVLPLALDQGTISWTYAVSDVNAPLTVERPAACDVQQAAGGLPLPPSASGVSAGPTFTSFSSSEGPDALEAFYMKELAAQGWEAKSAKAADVGGHEITASKDGATFSILIMSRDGASSSVLITQR